MNNSQLAHVWAQGNGLSKKGSSFSCEGNKLYSYYTVIGFIEKGIAFLSSDSMTPSTSKHLSHARHAVNGPVFYSPAFKYGDNYGPTVKECIEASIKALNNDYKALDKALSRLPFMIERFNSDRETIIKTAKVFKVKTGKLPVITKAIKARSVEMAEKSEQRERVRRENAEKAMIAARARDLAEFNAWIETGKGEAPYSYHSGPAYITLDGETVKTSKGAEAPLEHVKKAIKFYYSRKTDSGFTPYQTNGHVIHLGHFTLDSIDNDGTAKAGCHVFSASEIDRFTHKWGL